MAQTIEFPFVTLKAPKKSFHKEKDGNITVLAHLGFDAAGIDDETLLNLTRYADSSVPVKIAITLG